MSSVAVGGFSTTAEKAIAQQTPDDDWPTFQFDTSNTGHNSTTTGPKSAVGEKWVQELPGAVDASSALVDGILYVGSGAFGEYGSFQALNITNGSEIWSFKTEPFNNRHANVTNSCPSVVNGTVYFGDMAGNVYALNTTDGEQEWRFQTDDSVESSPTVVDGVVYIGSNDGNLYALNDSNGSLQWKFEADRIGDVRTSPAVVDGIVYFGSRNGKVYALNATTGSEIWSFETDQIVYSSPAVEGGTVYVGSYDGTIYALDAATGSEQWNFDTANDIDGYVTVRTSPAVTDDNDKIYVMNLFRVGTQWKGRMYSLDASNGDEIWRFERAGQSFTSAAIVDDMLYFAAGDSTVFGLDASDGSEQWSFDLGSSYVSSSPVVSKGTVYIGNNDGQVYALEEVEKEIIIDIKPDSDQNSINPNSQGKIPVAILQTEGFNPVNQLDKDTVRFGASDRIDDGEGAEPAHGGKVEDVNDDGDTDLLFHFPTQETGFKEGDEQGKLVGETQDGIPLFGTDSIRIVGKGNSRSCSADFRKRSRRYRSHLNRVDHLQSGRRPPVLPLDR